MSKIQNAILKKLLALEKVPQLRRQEQLLGAVVTSRKNRRLCRI